MDWNRILPDEQISEHEVVYLKPLKGLPEDGVATQEQIAKASGADMKKLDKEENNGSDCWFFDNGNCYIYRDGS